MEFWGIEVKSGQPLKVEPVSGMILHLSQACLGESKKKQDNEIVRLYVKNGDQKIVLGNLSLEKFPQVSFDLVFKDEFELSHDWKHGSIHFAGYKAVTPEEESEDESDDDSDLGEPVPVHALNNGTLEAKQASKPKATAKLETGSAKPKVNFAEPSKTEEASDDSEDDEDFEDDEEGDSSEDEEMANADDDDSDSDEDDSDEDEDESDDETPKKVEPSKKRVADSATKTPTANKKSKVATPQKTDGKKVSQHVATPHPAKQVGKTPANSGKSKQQTPKSGGSATCGSCQKSFGSDQALKAHSKAKHGA